MKTGLRTPARRNSSTMRPAEPVGVRGIRLAEQRTHLRRGDAVVDQRRVAGLEPQRHLAADRLQAAGELADTLLAGVVAGDAPAGAVGQPQRRGLETGGPLLRADQVRPGDGDLLGLGVAGQVDNLEPVAQRRQDAVRVVGGGDEEYLGQVEGQLDEGVAEAVVLGRVEHLEQDGGPRLCRACRARRARRPGPCGPPAAARAG